MTNEERWDAFIVELRAYIEEHHHGANKHTDLYNRTRYYRRKKNEGTLETEKSKKLEAVLSLRSNEHTGGRKKKSDNTENK